MKNILIPTDFSPSSNKAIDFAVGIAKQAGSVVTLIHACDVMAPFYLVPTGAERSYNDEIINEARESLGNIRKAIEDEEKIPVKSLISGGDVVAGILQAAKETAADLIVMGTLGESGVKEKLFGSITANVLQQSPLPVLAIPILCEWSAPRKILVAVNDFGMDMKQYSTVFELAALFKASVLITVFTDADHAQAIDYLDHEYQINKLKDKLQKHYPGQVIDTAHLDDSHFIEAIDNSIVDHSIDILAMFMHKRKFIERLFHPSISRKMSYHTTIPLLVTPVNHIK